MADELSEIETLSKEDVEKLYKQRMIAEKRFYCADHDYAFNCITSLNKHLVSRMHHHEKYIRYHCEPCGFYTKIKYDFRIHEKTKKHQKNISS